MFIMKIFDMSKPAQVHQQVFCIMKVDTIVTLF